MAVTLTSGFFPVAGLPAAQLVKLRVYIINLESNPGIAVVEVAKMAQNHKEQVVRQELQVPGNSRRMVEVDSYAIEAEAAEVTVTLPEGGFLSPGTGMRPGVAVVSEFTADQSVSLLQWLGAGEFTTVPVA